MSHYYSIPDLAKDFIAFKSPTLHLGVSSCAGYRRFQEDAHVALVEQLLPGNVSDTRFSFFGVFDGHGGLNSSQFLSKALYKNVVHLESNRLSDLRSREEPPANVDIFTSNDILMKAFLQTDEELRTMSHVDHGGSCCNVLIVVERAPSVFELICCNVGDSVCVFRDETGIHSMSESHSMRNSEEIARVKRAGGHVSQSNRVNGIVNMTRTFGNFSLKSNRSSSDSEQILIAVPSIIRRRVAVRPGAPPPYFLLCCDGLVEKGPISASCNLVDEMLASQLSSCYVAKKTDAMSKMLTPSVGRFNLDCAQLDLNTTGTRRSLQANYFENRLALDLICNDIINESILVRGSCDNHTAILGVFGRDLGKTPSSMQREEKKKFQEVYLPMLKNALHMSKKRFAESSPRVPVADEETEASPSGRRKRRAIASGTARKRPRPPGESEDEPSPKRRKFGDSCGDFCSIM